MEMTKWFDTNYHYLVPELGPGTASRVAPSSISKAIAKRSPRGSRVKPVLIGPLTYLWLSKIRGNRASTGWSSCLRSCSRTRRIFARLRGSGIEWVQLDEPALCTDLEPPWLAAFEAAYAELAATGRADHDRHVFRQRRRHASAHCAAAGAGHHIDLVRAPEQLEAWRRLRPKARALRRRRRRRNVWRTDLRAALARAASAARGARPGGCGSHRRARSCTCPCRSRPSRPRPGSPLVARVRGPRSWMSCTSLGRGARRRRRRRRPRSSQPPMRLARRGEARTAQWMDASADASRPLRDRYDRSAAQPFRHAHSAQRDALRLPRLPTTTIGSFPQTPEIRAARAACKRRRARRARLSTAHAERDRDRGAQSRKSSGSTCSSMARPSATTWSNISASSCEGYAFTEQRLGAELRLALREAADHLRRRVPARSR